MTQDDQAVPTVYVTVVCTDRGRHPRRRINRLGVFGDGRVLPHVLLPRWRRDAGKSVRPLLVFACSDCPRRVEWGDKRQRQLIAGLLHAGQPDTEIDISFVA